MSTFGLMGERESFLRLGLQIAAHKDSEVVQRLEWSAQHSISNQVRAFTGSNEQWTNEKKAVIQQIRP